MDVASAPFVDWPEQTPWYSLGMICTVAALIKHVHLKEKPVLWVPDYFCHDVVYLWKSVAWVRYYEDDLLRAEPRWRTLKPSTRDLVLFANFFGVRKRKPFDLWRAKNPCLSIDDHTHDPASNWGLDSECGLRLRVATQDPADR